MPDDALPWATVMYPVTAGGGGRGNYESSALVAGTFVFGFSLMVMMLSNLQSCCFWGIMIMLRP